MAKKLKKETKIHAFIKKHFMVIVVFAIMFIPSIYTVLFLGSMWDPYGNTGSLPVAIVNEDKSVIYGGKEINIGETLCDNLRKNNQLKFNFVDEQVALDGLENGTYYMVLVVPDNFSYNSTTLTSDNPQKMQLEYYVNPGTNYIASKFGESGVKSIKESINKSVINTYATTIYSKLDTIGEGFTQAADGSGQIYDGVGQLRSGNMQITNGLNTLSNGCLTVKEGTGTLKEGLAKYTDGVSQVNVGVSQLNDGVPKLKNGVVQLKDGALQLKGGTTQLKDGTAQLKGGTGQLVSNNDALNNGADQLLNGLNTMSDQLGESLTEENLKDLEKLEDGLIQINDGIQTLQKAVNEDYKISDETINEIKTTVSNVETFIKSDEFALLSTVISADLIDWSRIDSLCDRLEILPQSESNKAAIESLRNLSSTMQRIQGVGDKITPENAKNLVKMANSLIDAYYQLTDGVQQLSDGGNQALPVASDTLKKLTNGMLSIQNGLDRTVEKDGETGLIEGMTTLKSGIEQYTDGVSQVDSGAIKLDDGAIQLDDGVSKLSDGLNTFGEGIDTAGAGITKLFNGTKTLVKNNNKLNSGAGKLFDGTGQLYDGSIKLYNGTLQVDEGCEKLMFGANTLKESLADGAGQIKETNTGESAADMLSQPVEANETFQRTINTNGEAMSAYMMCAGLWVACLAFCLMFSPFKTSLGSRKTFIAHALISLFVSVVQAPIMVTLLMGINGMRPQNVGMTYVMAILASMAFMSIVYYLNTLLDSIGSFCLLILLCLQLSGAAGTYPIELSPKFYQIIHPFMPFAYGVDAFRSTLSTGNSLLTDIAVFCGIIIAGISLTCLTYEMRRVKLRRKEQHEAKQAA